MGMFAQPVTTAIAANYFKVCTMSFLGKLTPFLWWGVAVLHNVVCWGFIDPYLLAYVVTL